jgi:hypothetical protein
MPEKCPFRFFPVEDSFPDDLQVAKTGKQGVLDQVLMITIMYFSPKVPL